MTCTVPTSWVPGAAAGQGGWLPIHGFCSLPSDDAANTPYHGANAQSGKDNLMKLCIWLSTGPVHNQEEIATSLMSHHRGTNEQPRRDSCPLDEMVHRCTSPIMGPMYNLEEAANSPTPPRDIRRRWRCGNGCAVANRWILREHNVGSPSVLIRLILGNNSAIQVRVVKLFFEKMHKSVGVAAQSLNTKYGVSLVNCTDIPSIMLALKNQKLSSSDGPTTMC